ncbi:Anaphase promoting complex subunit 7 [Coemansia aciculifera]|uniref:Anaphase promoting complex subunit 7 n=1 Tax=Coemansia aciculifera TaxID=417176 RepID=A0ACC1LX22_9FUNG|nr:Anaphase promoting complex subunit 7 [Coemansia aciculifera]
MQATCHFELGAAERARKMFAQAAAIDPPLVDGLAAYAGTLARLGDRLALYALGRRLLAGDAGRAEGWVAMARFLLLSGRVSEALAVAWKAQAASPRLPDAFLAEGEAQMAAGAPADAVAALERAHAIAPSAQTYAALVAALVAAGRVKDAFVYAREAAEKMPRCAPTLAMVGSVLAHSPDAAERAERLLTAALDIDRRSAEAVDALAALYVASGRLPDALALVEAHLPEIQTDQMYTRFADVLTLSNDLPRAAVNYAHALHLNPENPRARAGFDRVDRLMHPSEEADDDEEEEGEGDPSS